MTSAILDQFDPRADDLVMEVGPGPGALTDHLAGKVASLVAVELDAHLAQELQARFTDSPGLQIHQGDVLELNWDQILPGRTKERRYRLLGNLPYSIATPLVVRALQRGDLFSDATVMVQKEVARRILARTGEKDYGPLAVLATLLCSETQLIMDVPPAAFAPPPQVDSAVVALALEPTLPAPHILAGIALARRAFLQRRKKLINALGAPSSALLVQALERLNLAVDARPEQIQPGEFVQLAGLLNSLETP